MPLEKVPHVQHMLIRHCHRQNKPVITATQMLQSMIENPTPTRAEVSDVANAIFDGTDAVMLSGETAVGKYPVGAVAYADRIADETEDYIKSEKGYTPEKVDPAFYPITDALSHGTAEISNVLDVKAAFCYTGTGTTALFLSKRRLHMPIVAVSASERITRKMAIYWGVLPLLWGKARKPDSDRLFSFAERFAVRKNILTKGDLALLVIGRPLGASTQSNILQIRRIERGKKRTGTRRRNISTWQAKSLRFTIDYDRCIECGACVRTCPADIYKFEEGRVKMDRERLKNCTRDLSCASECPVEAITIKKTRRKRTRTALKGSKGAGRS